MKPRRLALRVLLLALVVILAIGFYLSATHQLNLPAGNLPGRGSGPG